MDLLNRHHKTPQTDAALSCDLFAEANLHSMSAAARCKGSLTEPKGLERTFTNRTATTRPSLLLLSIV